MTEAVALLVGIGYPLIGFGLLGGWPHWGFRGRVRFCVVFPLHALLAALARDLWRPIRQMLEEIF